MPDPRSSAQWPKLGASIAVFRAGRVLIVERAKPPLTGVWSFPGGHVEAGETAAQAALRELAEETGVTAEIAGFAGHREVIRRTNRGFVEAHYVVLAHAGVWRSGEPVAASDVSAARFVLPSELKQYRLTEGAAEIVERARVIVEALSGR